MIARRSLKPSGDWEKSILQGFTMKSQDRHNKISMGISQGDGRIHISYDHHNTPKINYASTATGVADHPQDTPWNNAVFTINKNLGLDITPDLATYPDFVSLN